MTLEDMEKICKGCPHSFGPYCMRYDAKQYCRLDAAIEKTKCAAPATPEKSEEGKP